ncbi:MAG TPA: lactonase family protein [Caldilineaceae bacterium]|nr:lactonase family protein [Caldilineaceae bacterium]
MVRKRNWRIVPFVLNGLVVLLLLAGCTVLITPPPESGAAPTETETPAPEAEEAAAEASPTPAEEEEAAEATATPVAEEEAEGTPTPAAEEEAGAAMGARYFAYVGTYTRGAPGGWSDAAEQDPPDGIAVFAYNPDTGEMTHVQTVPSENPSFLAIHPSQQYLYAVNEIDDYEGAEAGSIEAYAIDPVTGELTLLNRQPIDTIPAHLAVDPTGSYVVLANYVGGSFQLLPIEEDGSLGAVLHTVEQTGTGPHERQEAPHPHATVFDPSGAYIATADLGTDQVQIWQIQDDQLVQVDETRVAAGSGPRHVAFHPNGHYLYVINELTATISVFPFDPATGQLGDEIQTIGTVPDDFPEHKSTAEIMVHPSGNFLYGSNRKYEEHPLADSIAAYRIDPATGELTLIGHTTEGIQFPRAFNFDPSGRWLFVLNQKGDSIVQFEIDQETGELTPTGLVIETPTPVSLVFKTQ